MDASRGKVANSTYFSTHDDCFAVPIKGVGPFAWNILTKDEPSGSGVVSILLL